MLYMAKIIVVENTLEKWCARTRIALPAIYSACKVPSSSQQLMTTIHMYDFDIVSTTISYTFRYKNSKLKISAKSSARPAYVGEGFI